MRTLVLISLFVGALAVSACGDDAAHREGDALDDYLTADRPSGPPTIPGGLPGALPGAQDAPDPFRKALEQAGTIELTDEMMESYAAIRGAIGRGEGARPGADLLGQHGLDLERWSVITTALGRAHLARARATQVASLEERLADLRAQRQRAGSDAQKEVLDVQIRGLEVQAERFADLPEPTETDLRNIALVERWLPRLKELSADDEER